MRRFAKFSSALMITLVSGAAIAGPSTHADWDFAEVVSVDPIIEYVSEPIDRQVCWDEPVTYREHSRRGRRSNGGALLGALIGGVVGNQFGSGHGRDAATVAGATVGYSIGKEEQRQSDYRNGRYVERVVHTEEQRCRIETDYRDEERVVGYDVAYRYNGRVYHTRTDAHPGNTIEVRVDVRPRRS